MLCSPQTQNKFCCITVPPRLSQARTRRYQFRVGDRSYISTARLQFGIFPSTFSNTMSTDTASRSSTQSYDTPTTMASVDDITTGSLQTLQSAEQRKVMDIVDKLRRTGLSGIIELPQLVVCGDQSSGKSSVLEAITEIPFPRKENLCTRFATEVCSDCSEKNGVDQDRSSSAALRHRQARLRSLPTSFDHNQSKRRSGRSIEP